MIDRIAAPWKFLWQHRPSRRSLLVLLVHIAGFSFAYLAAYVLRVGIPIPQPYLNQFWKWLLPLVALKLAIFYFLGHWRFSWRHATFSDLAAVLRAATLSTLVLTTINFMVARYDVTSIPRGILALDWVMTILTVGGLRAMWRLSREEFRALLAPKGCHKALIVGADGTGESLARQFLIDRGLNHMAVGFLDDNPRLLGTRLSGAPVLGTPDEAVSIASEVEVDEVLVISGVLTGGRLRTLMEECKSAGLTLKVIPAMDDLLSGDYTVQIRDVDINDLLRREPVELSGDAIRALVADRTVMVTGAGGSIGSEICRQVLKFRPRKLLLVERAENNLFLIEQEFGGLAMEVEIYPTLADITDRHRMDQIFKQHRPEVVFHAAAHKHVPMMECNAGEAVKNNVLGTVQLAELAEEYGVNEFVLISTDKSVNPTSVMGVSKQVAERFVHAFSEIASTKFVVVRFGNVLGSTGSVVPIFQEQIRHGGPVTVTHPDVERFFMTIPEASQLVLQAAAMGKGGEIFVLDMGEPVKIVDLAHDLIRLSKLRAEDIEIKFTGLRPGEKLYEELYFGEEEMLATPHSKLFVAYHRPYDLKEVRRSIAEVSQLVDEAPDVIREKLMNLVPEYRRSDATGDGAATEADGAAAGRVDGAGTSETRRRNDTGSHLPSGLPHS